MRILYLGNNRVAWRILRWLKEQGEEIVGLVVHPEGKRRYGRRIASTSRLKSDRVFTGDTLREDGVVERIRALRPDIGISVYFGYIVQDRLLNLFPYGCVNLHPAYLPYNRGAHPNVWSIVEDTPAGVTLHYMDKNIDTGDIIARRRVEVQPTDTGETLYRRLEEVAVDHFIATWPLVRTHRAPRIPQMCHEGTYHSTQDVNEIDHVDLDRKYSARELINIIRARTFPPYRGAYFTHGHQRIYMRLELLTEEELDDRA